MMHIDTRPARPDEAAIGAHLIFLSGPALFTYAFARPQGAVEALLADLWPRPGHLFSYHWGHVAVVEGGVQGLLLGYPGGRLPGAGLATAWLVRGRFGLRELAVMARRSWEILRIAPWVHRSDYYIAHLAVLPEARSRGIGARLLDLAEGLAREAGCARLALDVLLENERARALYVRAGFRATHTAVSRRFLLGTGYSGNVRMVKDVS